jgi:hypothetical protein
MALATLLEEAVRRFPRYHKYALGTDLRRRAYAVCRAAPERAQQGNGRRAAAPPPPTSLGRYADPSEWPSGTSSFCAGPRFLFRGEQVRNRAPTCLWSLTCALPFACV